MRMQRALGKQSALVSALGGVVAVYGVVLRPRILHWGATSGERSAVLPGDELLSRADIQATRAITVHMRIEGVWPWIAQMGQGRAGLYSYDWLENLVGCQMHSADRIVQEWQAVAPGDPFHLHPEAELEVVSVDVGEALVLRGGVQLSAEVASPFDFSWAFVLQPAPDGTTRLIVRERYQHARRWARLITEPVQAVSWFMTEKMLRRMRDRAEALVGEDAPRYRVRAPVDVRPEAKHPHSTQEGARPPVAPGPPSRADTRALAFRVGPSTSVKRGFGDEQVRDPPRHQSPGFHNSAITAFASQRVESARLSPTDEADRSDCPYSSSPRNWPP